MHLWEGKTRGGSFGYGVFIFLLRKVNIRFSYALLRVVAVYFWIFSNKKPLIYFYHNRLQFSKWLSYKAIYNNYVMLGECLLDKIVVMGEIKNRFTYDFYGEDYLHQLAEDKKGGILIGAHIGNWEIASHLLRRINIKVNIVMLDAEHQKIKKLLQNVLKKRMVTIIPIKNSYDHLYAIEQALNRGEFIAIHGDRFLPGAKTAHCRFLDEEALFPTGPFYMASKFKAPVCFVSAIKTNVYHYQFKATKPEILPFHGNIKARNLNLKKLIELYVKNLEPLVRENPTQWFNFYQFWTNANQEPI